MTDGNVAWSAFELSLDCARTINFAMQQNDVPLVRQIGITNSNADPVRDVRVRLTSDPEFFDALEFPVAAIPPNGTYTIDRIDLRLSADRLARLSERVAAGIRAELLIGSASVVCAHQAVEVLAFDEWNGLAYSMPELLAAFVLPNHPAVEGVLTDAARWLGDNTGDRSISGYQSRNPARVAQIVQAIYDSVRGKCLTYCNPPASFEQSGQKIRLPDRVFAHGLATCLDLAVLLAGCIEQAGIHPLVLLQEGHAFCGAWLTEEYFPDAGTEDLLRIRKRVDLGEIVVFESTLVTAPPPNDFLTAVAEGKRLLQESDRFVCGVDVFSCRRCGIRPIVVGGAPLDPAGVVRVAAENRATTVFELNQAQGLQGKARDDTPASRLDRWKRRLLDLSLRNRLINFRETKKTVPLLCSDARTLEDNLADGMEFTILARPSEWAPDAPRSTELFRLRTGTDGMGAFLQSELEARRLRAGLSDQELERRLTEMFRASRTALEEGGANTLYLALGFLVWYEADSAQQRRMAPIILIPIELRRNSVQEGVRIHQRDEEPRINITLLEMLAKDFDLHLPSMDPVPEDEHGIDVGAILATFRHAIKDTHRWDVTEDAFLGFFSFTKFLMWRDLEERTADLLENKVVNHLVNHANEAFPDEGTFPAEDTLDDEYAPARTFCPLPCDSSQLAAVHAAALPKSFVMFGPPGTGKSQTITNLIAQAIADGKSVLFVSEKMAALNVVHHRLSSCGLEPFCLELHSNKTNKRDVVEQLGQALDFGKTHPSADWERESARLAAARDGLNAYVRALHRPHALGCSIFQGLARLVAYSGVEPVALKLADPTAVTREKLEDWREIVERLETAVDASGDPSASVWLGCTLQEWSPALQRTIEADCEELGAACRTLENCAQTVGPWLGFGKSWTMGHLEFADRLARFLITSPTPPAALLEATDWTATESLIGAWVRHGGVRDELRPLLRQRYSDAFFGQDLEALARRVERARSRWVVARWLETRIIRRALSLFAEQAGVLTLDALSMDLGSALTLLAAERALRDADQQARELLGDYWHGGEADWAQVRRLVEWVGAFRKHVEAGSGGDPVRASKLKSRWVGLIVEAGEELQPRGAVGTVLSQLSEAAAEFRQVKARLGQCLGGGDRMWGANGLRTTLADVRERLTAWRARIGELRAWCNWQRVRGVAEQAGILALVVAFEESKLNRGKWQETFERSFYQLWTEETINREAVLREFFGPEHERKIRQFRELDEQHMQLTRSEIQARLAARRPAASNRANQNSETGILKRQRQLRRGHMSVRSLFGRIPTLLRQLKPCVLMSPMSVAQYLDTSHEPFDLVVFDEASQVPVWDAVGAIARGREVVIAGDPKQLPPTSFFSRADDSEAEEEVVEDVREMESILDDCMAARLPTMPLRWHYRSRHESLIAFSNYHYYENGLLTFPSPYIGRGVAFRFVADGLYDRGKSCTNRAEAAEVVADVVARLRSPQPSGSIGVVTFSMAQQTLVEDLLDEARRRCPDIEHYFGDDVTEPVFVKNLENVQGDERDIILISVCYGPDQQGRVSMNFGPLNREGGERRLNVAITRARSEVVVFSTLRAEHIDLSRTRARGAQDLKCFLDYAERGPRAIAQAVTASGRDEFESPFERAVCQRLRERGHRVETQIGCSGYRIDLAVADPSAPGRFVLGIECDGANYHSGKTARDRDRLREQILVGLGWRLHRVWSSDWWQNPEACVERIEVAIRDAMIAPREGPVVAEKTDGDSAVLQSSAEVAADAAEVECEELFDTEEPLPRYRAYRSRRRWGDPQELGRGSADKKVRQVVEAIVAAEAPLALDVLCRRVAACWNVSRVGTSVRERIIKAVRDCGLSMVEQPHATFVWPANADPEEYTLFRVAGPSAEDQRDIDEIPTQEFIAATLAVLRQQVRLPKDDLIREVAIVFGFQRAGQTIRRIVGGAVDQAICRGSCSVNDEGFVRLTD